MVKFLHFVNRKKRFFSLNNSLIIMWLYVEWFCLKALRQVLSHQPLPMTKANPIVVYIHVMKGGWNWGRYCVFVWWLQDNFDRRQGLKALQSIKDIEKRIIRPYSRHERSRIVRGSRS